MQMGHRRPVPHLTEYRPTIDRTSNAADPGPKERT